MLFPPLNDDQDELTYDEIYGAWDVRQLEHQYNANTSNGASSKGPWSHPELDRSPDYILDSFRETKHMIASLQEKEKRLKSEIKLHEQGKLDHLVDEDDPQKFNADGLSVSRSARAGSVAFMTPPFRWRSTPSRSRSTHQIPG